MLKSKTQQNINIKDFYKNVVAIKLPKEDTNITINYTKNEAAYDKIRTDATY